MAGDRWIQVGVAGAVISAVAAVTIAAAWWPRRVKALIAWGIVLVQVGWIILAGQLAVYA
jgi:hypothetical protein